MASSYTNENITQCKACRCGEGDTNIWTTWTSDNPEKLAQKCTNCQVFKSGPLFIASKGIGWTSWKKRWFILTRTSLVFYRTDPNVTPQKGSEANLTLGGIDLNSSGSIVVKTDKKLLTVLFPDGHDGRAFTLKAETSEDLNEWKTALENALGQAPSAALVMGQKGIFRNETDDSIEASFEQWKDKRLVKSLVVGRPVLLALEDIDGSPSFLEKALRFIESHGIKVEGILRQSADVEEVERRVQEYEQGKNEFSPDEDAHVVGDCIKHVLRELPSSPVPATCCTALVEAYRTDRGSRINAMHAAIAETFPDPNRRLVQRILKMMRTVASHKSENRMTLSALAACMAPLLLRPLLAGDCELEDDFNMGGDGSIQLLQAAAAANHAQAIVIILLEEYEKIFDEDLLQDGSLSSDLYSGSEDDVDHEESTDNDILEDDGYHDADNGLETDIDDDPECSSSGVLSESNSAGSDLYDNEVSEDHSRNSSSPRNNEIAEVTKTPSNMTQAPILRRISTDIPFPQHADAQKDGISQSLNNSFLGKLSHESHESINDAHTSGSPMIKSLSQTLTSSNANCMDKSNEALPSIKRPTVWGRTSARKNLSMESIDYSSEDEIAIQRLEMTKSDLQTKITKEVKGNAILQASLERRKEALHERRLALEQDVERLREQLQKERDLRASLEAGLMNLRPGHISITSSMDNKIRADLEEITIAEADIMNLKQKAADLRGQLSHQPQHSYSSLCKSCGHRLYSAEKEQLKDIVSTTLVQRDENSSKTEDILSGVTLESVQAQKQDSPSLSNKEQFMKQNLDGANQNNKISRGPRDASYAKDLPTNQSGTKTLGSSAETTIDRNYASKKSSPGGNNVKKDHAFQNSTISPGSSNASCAEELTTVVHDATFKTSSRDETSKRGIDSGNVKAQAQDSPSSSDKQPPQKLPPKKTQKSCTKSPGPNSVSSIEDSTTRGLTTAANKSSSRADIAKKETQDLPSLPNKQSQEQQPSTSSTEETIVSRNAASKKSTTRGEETASSSSSTLTKLTNRLNFLKERRVQLVNELEDLDTSGPEAAPLGTNPR